VVIAARDDKSDSYSHAEKLHVFIEETLAEAGLNAGQLDSVAVSSGPGSYTGLRIGVSAAKGIAFAKSIPLIAVDTLKALALKFFDGKANHLFIPMIDARRMEVFCAGFDGEGNSVFGTRAEILDGESFPDAKSFERVFFMGDGAKKYAELPHGFEHIPGGVASASSMATMAEGAFARGEFADLAYFEPFYLKDFVAGKPKKKAG
jgi:tRNA threonylcarbamoyladenosine biosynthesis protein TsaB